MDGSFNRREGKLVLCFHPHETDEASIIMELLSEDERRKGHEVPDFGVGFFTEFAAAREDSRLEFDSCHLGFAISFIGEVLSDIEEVDDSVVKLGCFLEEVKDWHAHHTVH